MLRGEPTTSEIFTLPLLGVTAIEIFRDQKNELYLLFIPFILVIVRLFLAQFQLPRKPYGFPDAEFQRSASRCVGWNQIAAFILLLMEFAAVIAGGDGVPFGMWVLVGMLYFLYLHLRFVSRRYWQLAEKSGQVSEVS